MKLRFSSFSKNTVPGLLVKSFLTAYALCAVFHSPLVPSYYGERIDFITASIYELLGAYDLKFMFSWVLSFCFYYWNSDKNKSEKGGAGFSFAVLPVFFALCLLMGQSYYETESSSYCFGSAVNFLKFLLSLAGYSILFHSLLGILFRFLTSHTFTADGTHFFTHHAFRKAFLILLGVYLPFLLLSFPGQLCWDAIGQIEQVIGGAGYSTHHPLFHTLLMGGFVKMGQALFHSPELGLFAYMLLQMAALAGALAATIAVLSRRGAKFSLLLCLLLLYCITPAYSNMASTALKDVSYSAAVIGYTICLGLFLESPGRIKDRKFIFLFLLLQTAVILLRNNGLYLILLSGIGCFVFLFRRMKGKQKISLFFSSFAGSILVAEILLFLLVRICSAGSGSIGEMLSIPFQQTARYLQLYQEEISEEERRGIEGILGEIDQVAASYDPAISDPVKALFRQDASAAELKAYLRAWLQGFFRHPASYFEAFFLHVYGWFTPSVSNSIRYEVESYDLIRQEGLFPGAQKLLIFYYRFAARFTPLGFLENIGVFVWGLCFLTFYQKKQNWREGLYAGLPLWISLFICMASPCFFSHPRYAFPILFTLPFLYGFTLTRVSCSARNPQKGGNYE